MRLLHWPVPVHVHVEWPKFLRRILSRAIEPVQVNDVRLRHLVDTEEGEPDSLIAVLEFNNDHADADDPEHIDLNQLKASLDNDGTFFIWTCSCGGPGCAGLFGGVVVAHDGRCTTWHDLDGKRKFVFMSQDLRAAFDRGIMEGKTHLNDLPKIEPVPEENCSVYQ